MMSARNLLALLVCFGFAGVQLSPAAVGASPSSAQMNYLSLAKRAVASAESHWRDRRLHWYDERSADRERYPLATIWGIVPLFQSLDAIAIAQPSAANRGAVERFASGAERDLNKGLRPVPRLLSLPGGPGRESSRHRDLVDDNGWWGSRSLRHTARPAYVVT
jgi:hypothetical protein